MRHYIRPKQWCSNFNGLTITYEEANQLNEVVVFDFLSDPMGGLLTSAREFLKRVRQYDTQSKIIVLELNRSISQYIGNTYDISWININLPEGLPGWRRILWQNIHLPRIIKEYNVNVYVSLSHYLPWTLPKEIKKVIGISNLAPFSKEAFDAERSWKKKLRLKFLSKSIISSANLADIVIALSNACKFELIIRGVSACKIQIIPNGVTISNNPDAPSSVVRNEYYILCVSHFYRYKNYERLVKAYSLLPKHLRSTYHLYLVGKPYDIDYFNEIKQLIKELGLEKNISLISGLFGVDLIQKYKNCSLFIFPSLIENSPITLLEAMAYGAPTIASDVAAMREFGQNGVVYFDPLSEHNLCDEMMKLLTDEGLRVKLSCLGKIQSSQYTWDAFSKSLTKAYLSEI